MSAVEHNWFNVTTWALRDWKAALETYYKEIHTARSTIFEARVEDRIRQARAEYRHRVLSWYRKLCLPMKVGEEVPDEVAVLLAEEWDEACGGGS